MNAMSSAKLTAGRSRDDRRDRGVTAFHSPSVTCDIVRRDKLSNGISFPCGSSNPNLLA